MPLWRKLSFSYVRQMLWIARFLETGHSEIVASAQSEGLITNRQSVGMSSKCTRSAVPYSAAVKSVGQLSSNDL